MTYHLHIQTSRAYYLFAISEEDLVKAIEAHDIGAETLSIPGEQIVHFKEFRSMRVYANETGCSRDQSIKAMQEDSGMLYERYWNESMLQNLGRDVTREKMKLGFGEKLKQGGFALQVSSPSGLGIWDLLHPKVGEVSRELFEGGHFKQAAQEALIAVDERVGNMLVGTTAAKKIGKDRMFAAFGDDPPLVRLFPEGAPDAPMMQEGYKFIFGGVMLAMRNPKSHRNFKVEELDAIEMLFFASRLLRKLDEAVKD